MEKGNAQLYIFGRETRQKLYNCCNDGANRMQKAFANRTQKKVRFLSDEVQQSLSKTRFLLRCSPTSHVLHTNIIKEIEKTIIFFPNSIIFIRFGRKIIIIWLPNHIYQQYFK